MLMMGVGAVGLRIWGIEILEELMDPVRDRVFSGDLSQNENCDY